MISLRTRADTVKFRRPEMSSSTTCAGRVSHPSSWPEAWESSAAIPAMQYRLALKNTFLHVKEVESTRARATSIGLLIRSMIYSIQMQRSVSFCIFEMKFKLLVAIRLQNDKFAEMMIIV